MRARAEEERERTCEHRQSPDHDEREGAWEPDELCQCRRNHTAQEVGEVCPKCHW